MIRSLVLVLAIAACSSSASHPVAGADAARVDGSITAADARTDSAVTTANDYDTDGPIPYTVAVEQLTAGGHTFGVTVYMPGNAGPHPVVSLSCGTNQTAAGYAPYGKRLASYGIAAIIADDPGALTNTSDVLPNALYVVDTYIAGNAAFDATKVGLAGHSRGGAVSLLAAEHLGSKVVAWFGLDAVDNEFGQAPREYARTTLGQLTIPMGYLGASVVSNCAPVADSYEMLYPNSPSPAVLVVGEGAGHTQIEPVDACTLCSICSPSGTADSAVVLAYSTRYFTAFFARELLGDTHVGAAFEGVGAAADVAAGRVTISSK
jgi:hypothetical protein